MTDYTDLISRLLDPETYDGLWDLRKESAIALEAQARRIAELEEVHEANLKAIQINADVFADGMKKIMALCDAKDARIAALEAALKQSHRTEASLASRIANLMDALEPFAERDLQDADYPWLIAQRAARAAYLGEKG